MSATKNGERKNKDCHFETRNEKNEKKKLVVVHSCNISASREASDFSKTSKLICIKKSTRWGQSDCLEMASKTTKTLFIIKTSHDFIMSH